MWLYVVRHAWAEERDSDKYPDDALRPLTAAGSKRFAKLARRLAEVGVAPRQILTSPLVRCRQTAEILAEQLPGEPMLLNRAELAPAGPWEQLLARDADREAPPDDRAWVGHAPDVGQVVAALIGAEGGEIHFAKGAIAAIEFNGALLAGHGTLRWLATAKLLGC